MSVSVKCFHNLFIMWPMGFILLTGVEIIYILLFYTVDFRVLLLSEKMIAFDGTF